MDSDAGVLQPPLLGCVKAAAELYPNPPGAAALAHGGAAIGRHAALLHLGVGHVLDTQLAFRVFQQVDRAIEAGATALRCQLKGSPRRQGQAQPAEQQEEGKDPTSHRIRSL
ncbi:hypothetical protein D9M71_773800 [compost metagenome]